MFHAWILAHAFDHAVVDLAGGFAGDHEPGAHGARYAITATDVPPPQIGTVEAAPGLVYAESRYGDWACVCEVLAPLTTYTECGETFVGVLQDGKIISAEEIAATHRYRHIQRD